MRVVGYTANAVATTLYILDEEHEVGKVTCTKKFAADIPKDMLFASNGRQAGPLYLVSVQSMTHRYTKETLLQNMLLEIETTMTSYGLDNSTLIIDADDLGYYEKYLYKAVAYSEDKYQYLVMKSLK